MISARVYLQHTSFGYFRATRFKALFLLLVALLTLSACEKRAKDTRPTRALPDSGFRVEFLAHGVPAKMFAGQEAVIEVTFKNISDSTWPSKPNDNGQQMVNFSYHWRDMRFRMAIAEGLRTPLPADVAPGATVTLNARIQAPKERGRYQLELTLVQEGVGWFSERGDSAIRIPVRVVRRR